MPKIVSVKEMAAIEKEANDAGYSYFEMMEKAGLGLANQIVASHSHNENISVLGLVGKGNNGGDTLIALDYLAKRKFNITAYILKGRTEKDPLIERLGKSKVTIIKQEDDKKYLSLKKSLNKVDVVIDGILGTGMKLPLKSQISKILIETKSAINKRDLKPFVVAVDCPTGMNCDSGEVSEDCLSADLTVCMAAVKKGMLTFPAFSYLGKIQVVDIGLPLKLKKLKSANRELIDQEFFEKNLPERPLNSHKGVFGTALIAAGSTNYPGAALLAGRAAYISGTGLVRMAVIGSIQDNLAGHLPEATWLVLPNEMGVIAENAADLIRKNLIKVDALLIGPGFGLEDTTRKFIQNLIGGSSEKTSKNIGLLKSVPSADEHNDSVQALPPMVIDADALKLLTKIKDWEKYLPPNSILTPHPGEMAVLTKIDKLDIQSARIETAEKFSKRWGHIVVLKGAITIISSPSGNTMVSPIATSSLAKAGTGDVLAGLITGFLAQGLPAFEAAAMGVWIHGQAGLAAVQRLGSEAGVLAGDLITDIAKLMTK